MKKLISMLMILIVVFTVAGCKKGNDDKKPDATENIVRIRDFEDFDEIMHGVAVSEYFGSWDVNQNKEYIKSGNGSMKICPEGNNLIEEITDPYIRIAPEMYRDKWQQGIEYDCVRIGLNTCLEAADVDDINAVLYFKNLGFGYDGISVLKGEHDVGELPVLFNYYGVDDFSAVITSIVSSENVDALSGETFTVAPGRYTINYRVSIVLLKNKDDILPLSKQSKIALVGVNADVGQTGDYSYRNSADKAISLLLAMNEKIGEDNINYAKGCNIATAEEKDIEYAVEQVKKSDVAVVVLGDNSGFFGGIGWGDETGNNAVTCGEGFDVNTLDLPPVQKRLFNKVSETGKPVVLVLYTGRPYAITDSLEKCDAFIQAWYPGEQGGNSLCDILFGDVCPSGKLSVSFPRSTGHIPCFYNHKPSARGANYRWPGTYDNPGRDYVFDNPDSLFTFGDGLSYTTFDYSDLVVEKTDNKVKVSVCVKNVGKCAGAESVLLFLRQTVCPVTPVVKKLRRFKRINLDKGESKIVEFYLDESNFTFIDFDMKEKVCHTNYVVMVGNLKSEIEI